MSGWCKLRSCTEFFLLSSSKRCILLMKCGVKSRAAFYRINTIVSLRSGWSHAMLPVPTKGSIAWLRPERLRRRLTEKQIQKAFWARISLGTDGSKVPCSGHSLMMVKPLNTGEPIKFAGIICCSYDLAFSSYILILYFSCHNWI